MYFTDTGTLCYLAGLHDADHAADGPMGGAIMETAVLSEILKTVVHRGEEPQVYFWRTSAGSEVDFVVESGGKLIPIEVKLSATPRAAMASGVRAFREDLGVARDGSAVWGALTDPSRLGHEVRADFLESGGKGGDEAE